MGRRRVNFGKKKRSFLKKKKKQKKSNPLPHKKKFHDFYFEEKKNPQLLLHIGLLVILPNSTLSVFNNKQKHPTKNQQTYKKQQKNLLLLDTQFVFLDIIQQFRIYNLLF